MPKITIDPGKLDCQIFHDGSINIWDSDSESDEPIAEFSLIGTLKEELETMCFMINGPNRLLEARENCETYRRLFVKALHQIMKTKQWLGATRR